MWRWLVVCIGVLASVTLVNAQDDSGVPGETIPEAMPLADEHGDDIVNVLLLGSDTTNPANAGRTDVMLIASINRTAGTVAFLSIPRDLYVYIPGWEMGRINTAYGHGENLRGEGQGAALLAETIVYNLGITVDYYARVDFEGFRAIVDGLGGVDISVDCTLQDWRLREPDLDPYDADNWDMFTLPMGVHRMDGDLALWYVRSRRTSSDFDRGRRQQDMLRALLRRARALGLLEQMTDIWPQVVETVDTDLPLPTLAALLPLAAQIDSAHIASYTLRLNVEVRGWQSPEGASLLLPIREALAERVRRVMLPVSSNQIVSDHITVEIVNASGVDGLDQVAADRLAWEGFTPIIGEEATQHRQHTAIIDYTGQTKGGNLATLQTLLRVNEYGVTVEADAGRQADYRVLIGSGYNACTHNVLPPEPPTVADAR